MDIRFEWDPAKAEANLRKHGVSFEEAAQAFFDPFALCEPDRIEGGEYRWRTLGMIDGILMLFVAHTVRDDDSGGEIVRIISARRADRKERRRYEQETG